mgnify:CR=1 FL=1
MADDKKIIFSMVGVSKSFQNNKQVLKDIYLSFFYGAKIGIIGLNGSGKSTLMKIIAGIERTTRVKCISPGYSVGYLAQEPQLTTQDCEGSRDGGSAAGGRHAGRIRRNQSEVRFAGVL